MNNSFLEIEFWGLMAMGAPTPELADQYVLKFYCAIQAL